MSTDLKMATPDALAAAGVLIEHHMAGGAYIKETRVKAGWKLVQHTHSKAHLSVLVEGVVRLSANQQEQVLQAPKIITIPAGIAHGIEAVTDVTWLCVWATDDTDPLTVDSTILKG